MPAETAGRAAAAGPAKAIRLRLGGDDRLFRGGLWLLLAFFAVALVLPLYFLLSKGFEDDAGNFVGLANYIEYVGSGALSRSVFNSLRISLLSTAITVGLAFAYAYALTHTRMPGRGLFKALALVPLLAPSLLPGIALVYMFGNQGYLTGFVFGTLDTPTSPIYGPLGIVVGMVFWTFPHAFLILFTALSMTDGRLYEAAESLGAGKLRTFLTVTVPNAKYGLFSACFVVFTLVFTDIGVPKVIGGQFDVLAMDIYKQVVGQQNFQMGSVVGVLLLIPVVLAFLGDRFVQRRQVSAVSSRATPFAPKRRRAVDLSFLAFCTLILLAVAAILGTAVFASLVRFWPYNLELGFFHYAFGKVDGGGWPAYLNSIKMALATAVFGSIVVFVGAYLIQKTQGVRYLRGAGHFLAILPVAVPGLVLGLGYIFFFNHPDNPLNFLYGSLAILVICTIVHFYAVPHLTATTALRQLDPEFEAVSRSLKVPVTRTFFRVTVPVCMEPILNIAVYFFINAMTTVSAVVFLYSAEAPLASVAVLNMDDAGDKAPAAAMATLIVLTCALSRVLYAVMTKGLSRRTRAWARPAGAH